jgi:type IV secretory pathway VirB4 component
MTKIFLPDNSATDPLTSEAYTKLGLTETEIINLSSAVQKKEYFLAKKGYQLKTGQNSRPAAEFLYH